MIVAAHEVKAGGGRGKATAVFDVANYVRKETKTTRKVAGAKRVWKTLIGFSNHCKTELGWTFDRSRQEWDHLKDNAAQDEKRTTRDRVTGSEIEWILVDMEEYVLGEVEMAQSDELVLEGKRKRPLTGDLEKMRSDMQGLNQAGFNDTFFSPLKAGRMSMANPFSTGAAIKPLLAEAPPSSAGSESGKRKIPSLGTRSARQPRPFGTPRARLRDCWLSRKTSRTRPFSWRPMPQLKRSLPSNGSSTTWKPACS